MDQGPLVRDEIEDGAKLLSALREGGVEISAAWLMKAVEDGLWFLYLATKLVDELGITPAYRKTFEVMRPLEPLLIEWSEVKLVSPSSKVAQEVLEIQSQFGDQRSPRFGGKRLGGISIESAYIYPQRVVRGSELP